MGDYDSVSSPKARLVKALDKLETIMQHNRGLNPRNSIIDLALGYGRQYTGEHPVIIALRTALGHESAVQPRSLKLDPRLRAKVLSRKLVDAALRLVGSSDFAAAFAFAHG